MSQGDEGAQDRPASANMLAATPRPKPPVPGAAPPRPGTPGRATPPPPVPTAAKAPPPPARAANPFLAPESAQEVDESWLALEDAPADQGAVAGPASPGPTSAPRIRPPASIAKVELPEQAPIAPSDAEPAKPPSVGGAPSKSEPPPFKPRSRAKVVVFMLFAALALGGGGFVYQSQATARSATMERAALQASVEAPVEPPAPTSEPAPPPTFTAEPPPSPPPVKKNAAGGAGGLTAAVSADPAKQGIIDTTQLPAGRRIVVDGRLVGTSPGKVAIRCGAHRFQIGDLPPENITLPCGGEVNFTD